MSGGRVRIHYGRSPARISRQLLDGVARESTPTATPFLFLVQTHLRRRQLASRLLDRWGHFFDQPVLTLSGLVRCFLKRTPDSTKLVEERHRRAILAQFVWPDSVGIEAGPLLEQLTRTSCFIGYFRGRNIRDSALLRLYYQRQGQELGPDELSQIDLMERYQAHLEAHGWDDWEGVLGRFYDALVSGQFSLDQHCPGAPFYLVLENPEPATPLEAGVLRMLLKSVPRAEVVLYGKDPGSALDSPLTTAMLEGLDLEWTKPDSPPQPAMASVWQAQNRRHEIELAAAQLASRPEAAPGPGSELALIAPDPELYQSLVDEILPRRGLVVAPVHGRSCVHSLLVQTFRQYLDLLQFDFEKDLLFDFLLNPLVQTDVSPEQLRSLERWAAWVGVKNGLKAWLDEFTNLVTEALAWTDSQDTDPASPLAPLEHPSQLLERFTAIVQSLALDISRPRSLDDWLQVVTERIRTRLQPTAGAAQPGSRRDRLLFQTFVIEAYREAVLWPRKTVDFAFFREWCIRLIPRVRAAGEHDACVYFGAPEDFQDLALGRVVWVGMTEDEFPRIRNQDFRTSMPGEIPASAEELLAVANRCVQRICDSSQQLVFTFPRVVRDSLTQPSSCLLPFGEPQARARPGSKSTPPGFVRRACETDQLRERDLHSPWDGCISDPSLLRSLRKQLFPKGIQVSPTLLEAHIQCGFRFLSERVWGLSPHQNPSEELNPLELGRLLHRVLRRFFLGGYQPPGKLESTDRTVWTQGQGERMNHLLEEELHRLRPPWRPRGLFLQSQIKALQRGLDGSLPRGLLAEFVDQTWRQRRNSEVYEVEHTLPPQSLGSFASRDENRVVQVRVDGKVDRIDRGTARLVVVDYKTGGQQHVRLYQGWGYQLPLYLMLAEKAWPGQRIGGAFYLFELPGRLERRELKLRGPLNNGLGELIEYYRRKALRTAQAIYHGRFPITLLPRRQAGCAGCAFRLACGYQPERAEAMRQAGGLGAETIIRRGHWVGGEEK